MKSSLSSVQWDELVVDLMLCLLEWTLDHVHLEEGFMGGFGKAVLEELVLCGAEQQSVRAAGCENTPWLLAWHTPGGQQELTVLPLSPPGHRAAEAP